MLHSVMCYNETVIFPLYFKLIQFDDDFEIKSKYYSFIIVHIQYIHYLYESFTRKYYYCLHQEVMCSSVSACCQDIS